MVGTRYGEYAVDGEEGTVSVPSLDCELGLSNLAQTCRAADREDWRLLIYNHISRLDDFAPDALAEKLADYGQVRDDLRIRVVSDNHTAKVDAVADPLPVGLWSCLSVDLGGAACPVAQEYLDGWGVDRDEAMATALANSLASEQLQGEATTDLAGNFRVYTSESLFGSAHLLDFARTVPDIGEMGAVVMLPAATVVMVCPVGPDKQFVDDSATMLAAGYIRYLAGPNSVSPNALWWRPDHPLEGFACMERGFELVAPKQLRSYIDLPSSALSDTERPDAGLDL